MMEGEAMKVGSMAEKKYGVNAGERRRCAMRRVKRQLLRMMDKWLKLKGWLRKVPKRMVSSLVEERQSETARDGGSSAVNCEN